VRRHFALRSFWKSRAAGDFAENILKPSHNWNGGKSGKASEDETFSAFALPSGKFFSLFGCETVEL
jgi:hypothetical protein